MPVFETRHLAITTTMLSTKLLAHDTIRRLCKVASHGGGPSIEPHRRMASLGAVDRKEHALCPRCHTDMGTVDKSLCRRALHFDPAS